MLYIIYYIYYIYYVSVYIYIYIYIYIYYVCSCLILRDRIEVQPKTTNNKMMQTALEEIGEVVYYRNTWSIAFDV